MWLFMLFIAMLNNLNMLVKSKVSTYINGLAEVNIYRKNWFHPRT